MIPRVTRAIGRTMLRLSFVTLLSFLVVTALYVSLGRQFVPMVSNYAEQIEQRLSTALSANVTLGDISGEWERFSPRFIIQDLALRDHDEDEASLRLQRVVLSPDIPASLLQRRMVLGVTRIEGLQLTFEEHAAGEWSLVGLSGADAAAVSAAQVFEWLKSLALLELEQTRLQMQPLLGDEIVLEEASLQFQSMGSRHVAMLRAESTALEQPVVFYAEMYGDQLSELSGQVYLSAPSTDYAPLLRAVQFSDIAVPELTVQGEFWVNIEAGQLKSLTARGSGSAQLQRQLASEDLSAVPVLSISQFSLDWLEIDSAAEGEGWSIAAEGLGFSLPEGTWPAAGFELTYQPDQSLRIHADVIELGLLAGMVSALMPDGPLQTEIEAFNPRGQINDALFTVNIADGAPDYLALVANLRNANISAHRGSPSIWGVNAYTELSFDVENGFGKGYIEVDSSNMMMHLPSLFNDVWSYDYVNGRVGFQVDTSSDLTLRLASSIIDLRSDIINGRAQFSTDIQTGENRSINLELMVGVMDADISQKSLYLPTAPQAPASAQGVLSWIDDAVLAGSGAGSGLIFRGRVQRGATVPERTLQMFYNVVDGTFRFDPQWPVLEALEGYAVINNAEVDVAASAGRSLGINFSSSVASVRTNPEGGRWLTVSGSGRGSAQHGLQYLQQSPVTQGLGQNLASWEVDGDTDFGLELSIPLSIPGAQPDIRLELGFENNNLLIPEYALQANDLRGGLVYTAVEGLRSHDMKAQVLGHIAEIDIRSDGMRAVPEGSKVTVTGDMPFDELLTWSGLPQFAALLLTQTEGSTQYTAELNLPAYGQYSNDQPLSASNRAAPILTIRSDMGGVALNYPAPFNKMSDETSALDIQLEFLPSATAMSMQLAEKLQMNLRFDDAGVQSGLVYLGPSADGLRVRRLNATAPGIEVVGQIAELDYNAWSEVISRVFVSSSETEPFSTQSLTGIQGSIEVQLGRLNVFDETFEQLDVRLGKNQDLWTLTVAGDAVAGSLAFPAEQGQPLMVDLDHLHLSRSISQDPEQTLEEAMAGEDTHVEVILDLQELPPVEYMMPRSDPLAGLDPRNFPDMVLSLQELTLAGSEFGRWAFNLTSDSTGAHFTDLQVESRGLKIGSAEEPGEFRWIYDGDIHRSVLNSGVFTSDLGPVFSAYGYAPSIQSASARFDTRLHWDGSPAYFSALGLNGDIDLRVNNGRFQQRAGVANSALRLISIVNFDAVIRRLRFSDDLARAGLAYDEITGRVSLADGIITIVDRLQIAGPSSLFQIAGELDLAEETINADLYITLPVSDNIPWLGGLAVLNNLINWQLAIGVFLFDRIFGDQVDSLTSAHYTLQGPWEGLEPRLYQVFSGGGSQ